VEDLAPQAVKSGMLASVALVEMIAALLPRLGLGNYVLDPVMVATSGDRLLEQAAEGAIRDYLIPLATLVTPNLEEARILTGLPVEGLEGQREAARALVDLGAQAALVKGGHGGGAEVVDLLWDGEYERLWRHPRLTTRHTHGTGCTLSAAITAGLAQGHTLGAAVGAGLDFVVRAIASAPGLGSGHGPVNHLVAPKIGSE